MRAVICGAAVALVAAGLWGCGGGSTLRSASPTVSPSTASPSPSTPSPKVTFPPGADTFLGRWKWTDANGQGTVIVRARADGTFLVRDRGVTGTSGQGGEGWNYVTRMRCVQGAGGRLELREVGSVTGGKTVRLVGKDEIVVSPPGRHCFRAAGT